MTYLYLGSPDLIPAGTVCRVFGQIHDGRTVIETRDELAVDGLEPWGGMQGNGIPIGIDDTTPGEWIEYAQEEDALPDITKTLADLKTLRDRCPDALDEAISLDESVGLVMADLGARMKPAPIGKVGG